MKKVKKRFTTIKLWLSLAFSIIYLQNVVYQTLVEESNSKRKKKLFHPFLKMKEIKDNPVVFTTRVQDTSDKSATLATRVQHEWDTTDMTATRV